MGVCWTPPLTRRQRLTLALATASLYLYDVLDVLDVVDNLTNPFT